MRNSLAIFAMFTCLFLTSCSKNSSPGGSTNTSGGDTTATTIPTGGSSTYTSAVSAGAGALMAANKTDFNSPSMGSGVVGGKMYIGGGDIVGGVTGSFEVYNVSGNNWTSTQMDTARDGMAVDTLGSKIFFAGGYKGAGNYSGEVDIYDAGAGTWTTATLSVPRFAFAVASAGSKIVFAGGSTYYTGIGNFTEQPSAAVDIYDIGTDTWSTATLSVARNFLTATASGTKLFFAGGYNGTTYSNVVDIYDVSSGAWTTATLSAARGFLAAAAAGNDVLFAGGVTGGIGGANYVPSSVVDIYNTSTGAWTTSALSQARGSLAATAAGNLLFFGGGNLQNNNGPSSTVDIYNVTTGQWLTPLQLSVARQDLAAASFGTTVVFAGGDDGTNTIYGTVDLYTVH
jgi:hypothetical protein